MTAFYKDQRFDGDAFLHQQNPFARRNVTAIVLEVPSELIGKGKINAWATISLFGHAPEVQVSRWGLPTGPFSSPICDGRFGIPAGGNV